MENEIIPLYCKKGSMRYMVFKCNFKPKVEYPWSVVDTTLDEVIAKFKIEKDADEYASFLRFRENNVT